MEMHKVKSSNVVAVGFDPGGKDKTSILAVEFRGGKVYRYEEVSFETFEKLLGAESVGSFIANNIKGKYKIESAGEKK